MNKFELDKTMEVLEYKKADKYEVGGCEYYHDDRYFTIVTGKTPYELAKLIYEKYDNNIYKIRVDGLNEHNAPIHDVYAYHIDTIEGLAAFLLETQDYYSKTKGNAEYLAHFLKSIYAKILEEVNPKISIYDWMLDRTNRKEYFKRILNMNSITDFKLRKAITDFDNAVNPFVENDVDFNNSEFVVRGYNDENTNSFSLTDKESGTIMSTIKEKDKKEFTIKFHAPTEEPYGPTIYHYYFRGNEIIAFESFDKLELKRLEYNITDNSFGEHYGEKHEATEEDKIFVIERLQEYTSLANDISAKNLGIDPTAKTFVKKQEN